MSAPTLEEFVENYISNKAKENEKKSYADWLKSNGVESERIYADSVKDISGDYKRAKSEYGTLAESLWRLGLTSSGYSDYLSGKAYSEMQKRKTDAKALYNENEAKNKRGYSEYIEKLEKKTDESYESTVAAISNAGIMSYEDAYAYAIGAGLTAENAALAAKSAGDAVRKRVREKAIKTIIEKSFNKDQAREYALAVGLGEDVAKELGEYADAINTHGYYSSEYLDYIKNKVTSENGSKK